VIPRVDGVSAGTRRSLKRKRDDDDDDDELYGDRDDTKTKPREDPPSQRALEFAPQFNGSSTTVSDETEWLMFLVTEKGELQV